ncbi:MAG: transcriptional regulator, partial [Thiovulaceae bacterium]|nr:transcriptional regulator [Sulfurimonadaceae bacterium]
MSQGEQQKIAIKVANDLDALGRELSALALQLRPIAPDCSLGDQLRAEMMHDQEVTNSAFSEAEKRYNRL